MATKQLSDGNPDGTVLGQSSADLVSLYGATTVVQADHIADAVAATGVTASTTGTAATAMCSNADHAALVTIINTLLDDLSDLGVHASS